MTDYKREYKKEYKKTPAGKAGKARYRKRKAAKHIAAKLNISLDEAILLQNRYNSIGKQVPNLREKQTAEEKKIKKKNDKHKRRTLTKTGDVSTQQLLHLKNNSSVCYWCGISLSKVEVHIDHYIPLSKGGEHTINNLVVSCSRCNISKSDKDPTVFAASLGKLL